MGRGGEEGSGGDIGDGTDDGGEIIVRRTQGRALVGVSSMLTSGSGGGGGEPYRGRDTRARSVSQCRSVSPVACAREVWKLRADSSLVRRA